MRLSLAQMLGSLLLVSLLAGCSPPKPADDGSGPRAAPSQMTNQKGKKVEKPMGTLPPKPPAPPGK